jgi:protein-serine/threonine kinase
VTPSSFQKIKLLGKGDVGKVYLVREKKTEKLFAMKGEYTTCRRRSPG